jgi:hypothetical protein
MIAGAVLAFSIALLAWFRYACRLILGAKPARDHMPEVAAANELRILEVQQDLPNTSEQYQLDTLHAKLERDYRLLNFLLRHSPTLRPGTEIFEHRLIMLDFEFMKACYALMSRISRSKARRALQEMSQVVCYFGNRLGERARSTAAAE